jgi:hypothetical protein
VRDTLKTIPGVKSVEDVDFSRGRATVIIDLSLTKPETVATQLGEKTNNRYQARVITP